MPNPIIRIHNVETGEIIDREMNAAEFKAYKEATASAANDKITVENAAKKEALLAKLGITAEEAALLLS